jgi:iron complex transport system substrate-binding protein
MKHIRSISLLGLVVLALACSCTPPKNKASGERILAPPDKIYSPNFGDGFLVYMMDPERVAGWATPLKGHETKFIPERYQELPMFGGWWSNGIPDKELLLREGVKKGFISQSDPEKDDERREDLEKQGIAFLVLKSGGLTSYAPLFRELGRQMVLEERGEALAGYFDEALSRVQGWTAGLGEEEMPRVYIAHGPVGLVSQKADEALKLAGARNVLDFSNNSYPQVSFEEIMRLDPDVIVVSNPDGARSVRADPKWRTLRAAREGRLYVVPMGPFGWMHQPELMRIMGVQWLAWKLHPARCDIDIRRETKRFTDLFMHTNLSEAQIDDILAAGAAAGDPF